MTVLLLRTYDNVIPHIMYIGTVPEHGGIPRLTSSLSSTSISMILVVLEFPDFELTFQLVKYAKQT